MKRHTFAQKFKKALTPIACLMAVALGGCGSDNNNGAGVGGGGIPGGTVVSPTVINPDGSMSVAFQGTGTLISQSRMLAGTFPVTTGNIPCPNDSSGQYFCFRNQIGGFTAGERIYFGQTFGAINVGAVAAIGGAAVQKVEKFYGLIDGGRSNISISVVSNGGSVSFSGVLTLSPQYMSYELRGNPVTSLAFDLSSVASGGLGGQVFVLTNSPYRSFFVF